MTRIVLFSDSHQNFHALHRVVEAQPEAAAFVHLGDGFEEMEDLQTLYPDKLIRGVRGNCDWGCDGPAQDLLVIGGKRLFYTHGHHLGVKSGLDKLIALARGHGAHIAAFGHTHVPFCEYVGGLYLINPGSVSHPRAGKPSYGIVDITPEGGVAPHIVEL